MSKRSFAALLILLLWSAFLFAQEEDPVLTVTKYSRGTREVESQILFQRTAYMKGPQTIEISDALLGKFVPDYVEFYLDSQLIEIDSQPPFKATIDTGTVTKKRTVMVVGVKESLLVIRKMPRSEQDEPDSESDQDVTDIPETFTMRIIEPSQGSYAVGRTSIVIEAEFVAPGARLESAQIYVDDELVNTMTSDPWTYVHDFGRKFNGRTVSVIAFDNYGRRAQASITTSALEQSTLFIEARVVTLDVTVTDDRGKFIGGLDENDFQVYEDGKLQDIKYFTKEERPIWVAILIDTSSSMRGGKMRRSVFAAQQFISQLKPADHAMVMTFGPDVKVISEFTQDFPVLIDEIGKITSIKDAMTPLNQSLYNAMDFFRERVGRRAIILITDGADTASHVTPDQVNELAKQSDVRIYSIAIQGMSTGSGPIDGPASYLLRGLADVTGGDSYFPISSGEFFNIFKIIADELRSQYTLGYNPPKSVNNEWREIEVKVKDDKGIARAKKGYYPQE